MNKIIEWFKLHWQQRIFKLSTICGLILFYLEIFHHNALNSLIDNILVLIGHIITNSDFITTCVGVITAYLIGTKKF